MQHRDQQGEGQRGGQQGANTSGNKNQLGGNQGNPRDQTSSQNRSQGQASGSSQGDYNSNVNRNSDVQRSTLSKKFGQKYGLNQQQSDDAADSWLGSVNWASKQNKDDDFSDFVNPQTPSSKNSLYNGWQDEYKNRLRKSGFEESQANKLGSEEPDSYFQELSNAGSDENWYRNSGNDGRDVSIRSDERDEVGSRSQRSGSENDGRSRTSEENGDRSDAEGSAFRKRREGEHHA